MKRVSALFVMLLLCADLSAAMFGGEPYEVFDEGGTSYVIFGNSLLTDNLTLYGEGDNRQGDTCRTNSRYTLKTGELPIDAVVRKAYLIWTGAVDPAKLAEPTDSTVTLDFYREDGYGFDDWISSGIDGPKYLGDTTDPFLFESVQFTAEVPVGCSETEPGTMTAADLAYFTYRVDVTDFFEYIQWNNELVQESLLPGETLYGDYTVSDLDCTDSDVYRCSTLMVSNWALLLIYQSSEIIPQTIYLYPGFMLGKEESLGNQIHTTLANRDLPYQPTIRMTMLSSEGDPALMPAQSGFEMLFLRGNEQENWQLIADDCDPEDAYFNEIWDSRPSSFSYNSEKNRYCTSYDQEHTFSLDIDNWYLDTATDEHLATILSDGNNDIHLSFNFTNDEVLTNLLILAVDKKSSSFDIPGKDELLNCVCFPEEPHEVFCGGEPQYFLLTVENWGGIPAESVYAKAGYDTLVFDYIPGTTEVATEFDEAGNGLNWQKLLDGPEDKFPLLDPNLIANRLDSFKLDPEMATSYLIRFRLLPKTGLEPNRIAGIGATISDTTSSYNTNTNIPLHLFPGECTKTCTLEELKNLCGGPSPDDPDIFDPTADDDAIAATDDELSDEMPDATVDETPEDDPDEAHPMKDQEPGCSLTMI